MGKYDDYIDLYKGDLDPNVIRARIKTESGGNPTATAKPQQWKSGYGSEIGLLQMSPDTRKQYKISEEQAKDPEINLRTQLKQWNAWSKSFFGKTPPKNPVERNTWGWLVTSIGPGAARKIRDLTGGDYSLGKLAQVANNPEVLAQNKNYWGSQSPQLVAKRIKSGISKVTGAFGRAGKEPRSKKMGTIEREKLAEIAINRGGEYTPEQQAAALKQIRTISRAESVPTKIGLGPSITKPAEPEYTQDPRSESLGLTKTKQLTKKYGTSVITPETKKVVSEPAPIDAPPITAPPITAPPATPQETLTTQKTTRGFEPTEQLAQMKQEREAMMGRKVKIGEAVIGEARGREEATKALLEKNMLVLNTSQNQTQDSINRLKGWAEKTPEGFKFHMGLIEKTEGKLSLADEKLQQAVEDVSKYDAKYEMPLGKRILFAIAAAFSGFANGFGVRGNAALDVMNKYIDREVNAKKRKLEQLIKVRGFRKEHRGKVEESLEKYGNSLKEHMLKKAQIEAAKIGFEKEGLVASNARADTVLGVAEKLSELERTTKFGITKEEIRAKEKAAPVTVTQTKVAPKRDPLAAWVWKEQYKLRTKGRALKTLKPKFIKDMAGDHATISSIKRLFGKVKGKDLTPIKEMLAVFGTDAGAIIPQVRAMARQIGRHLGVDKGNFAEKEGAIMVESITGKSWNKAAQAYKRLKEMYNDSVHKYESTIKGLARGGYDVAPLLEALTPKAAGDKAAKPKEDFGSRPR